MARVTGIGGIFLRARDPRALALWYTQHLGIQMEDWNGSILQWSDDPHASSAYTLLSLFPQDTKNFGPGTPAGPQAAMLNLRVDDLDALLAQLAAANIPIDPKRDDSEYGRFAWITDPEGNRLELFQPPHSPGLTTP